MRFRSSSLSIASVPVLALLAACSGGSFDVATGGTDSGATDSISSDTSVADSAVATDAISPPDTSPVDANVVVDGATCDTTKSPLDAPCVVSDLFGFFVSASGDDTNPGTAARPFKTITKAYAKAALAARHRIFVCNETFTEQVVAVDSIDLYGGLDCKNGWVPSGSTTLNSPVSPAMVVKGFTSGARIESFVVTAPHGSDGGGSSIGLFVWGSQKVLVRASTFNSSLGGAGKVGGDGSQGDTAAPGGSGATGQGCSAMTMPPVQVKGGAGGPTVGSGGAGATCDCVFLAKNTPFPGSDGALATSTCGRGGQGVVPSSNPATPVCTTNNLGQPGCPGASGSDGGGGKPLGGTSADGYVPADGGDGGAGGIGGGGGGGGTALVNSLCFGGGGGGGGGGGAGGKGTAGGGGGASFGVLSVNSDLTLRACKANGAKGGAGGNGGIGGKGGSGAAAGQGGPASVSFGGWAGCGGGAGGEGGTGGDGGGGGGGPSAGVAYSGTQPISKDSTVAKAGLGGAGGGSPGNLGAAGTASDLLSIP